PYATRLRFASLTAVSLLLPWDGVNPHFAYGRAIGHGHARVVALLPLLADVAGGEQCSGPQRTREGLQLVPSLARPARSRRILGSGRKMSSRGRRALRITGLLGRAGLIGRELTCACPLSDC